MKEHYNRVNNKLTAAMNPMAAGLNKVYAGCVDIIYLNGLFENLHKPTRPMLSELGTFMNADVSYKILREL